jgi:D-ribose pyranase
MLKSGILNPYLAALLSRFRHTNTLVISDRGFPYWPAVPTVDISLVDDIPTVRQVLRAVTGACTIGNAWMAKEFHTMNSEEVYSEYASLLENIPIQFEHHVDFKKRVPLAIGLIRTGDTTQYGNIILQSA